MDTTSLTKPERTARSPHDTRMSFEKEPQATTTTTTRPRPLSEFDPCANAKITSPFYLYNHDSPRPSVSGDSKATTQQPIHISVKDLESGQVTETLTTVDTHASSKEKRRGSRDSGKIKLWNREKPKRCMTKKHPSRWKTLSVRQRFWIKIAVFLVLAGAIVGIAVGVSITVHGGVYSGGNGNKNIQ